MFFLDILFFSLISLKIAFTPLTYYDGDRSSNQVIVSLLFVWFLLTVLVMGFFALHVVAVLRYLRGRKHRVANGLVKNKVESTESSSSFKEEGKEGEEKEVEMASSIKSGWIGVDSRASSSEDA